jgi:predicted peptidase
MNGLKLILMLPLLVGLSACCSLKNSAAAKPGQTAENFSITRKQVLAADYLLFLPQDYAANSAKRWPLILFLHGAGERGTNVWLLTAHGPPDLVRQNTNFPFIVVSPQCPDGQMWSDDLLLALLDEVEKKYTVDTRRVYLTGLSMGGFGAWNLGLSHPEKFAAIAPASGGGETILLTLGEYFDHAQLAKIKTLGVWAFHGGKDPTVAVEESERMVDALKKAGCTDVRLTIYPEAKHDCWTETYDNPELYEWFLKHSR